MPDEINEESTNTADAGAENTDNTENTDATDDQANNDSTENTDKNDNTEADEKIDPDKFEVEERRKADEASGDEDDDIDADDKEKINKVVNKRLSPLEKRLQEQSDEIDVNAFIIEKPEMAKYKPVILKYMKHPAYKNIPVKNIAAIVSAPDMQKIGAQKEREAQKKVASTKNNGSQSRKADGGKFDAKTASFQDMEKYVAKIKGQQV